MKEYQKPLKRKGLALFPKGKGKTARIRERNGRGETDLFLNGKEEKVVLMQTHPLLPYPHTNR